MSTPVIWQSLMFAYIFWVGLSLGSVGLLLLHHMLKATWGLPILRFLEAGTKTLIPMAIIFFALLFGGAHDLWPWAMDQFAHNHVIMKRAAFNTIPMVAVRSFFYFAFWIVVSQRLISSAAKQDKTGDKSEEPKRTNFAAPMMVLHVLVMTIAFTDWVMSLDPAWFSTILGAWFIVCQSLSMLAFSTILLTRSSIKGAAPYAGVVNKTLLRDLGNLMLGFTMLWAYFSLSQFLIIWSGNLPEETGYYATRMNYQWNAMGTILVLASFFLPFLMLLYNHTKRHAVPLYRTAVIILAMRVLDMYWTIIPFFNRGNQVATPTTHLIPSAILFVVVGAIWLVSFKFFWQQATPLPTHDPRLELSSGHGVEAHGHA